MRSSWYALKDGVWFVGTSVNGPWAVADSVPEVIYTIPPSSPLHYVTYVYVYGATPQIVTVGYTPGYYGTVLAPTGVVVYGTGYVYPPVYVGILLVSAAGHLRVWGWLFLGERDRLRLRGSRRRDLGRRVGALGRLRQLHQCPHQQLQLLQPLELQPGQDQRPAELQPADGS